MYVYYRDSTLKLIIKVVALLSDQNSPCRGCLLLYTTSSLDKCMISMVQTYSQFLFMGKAWDTNAVEKKYATDP
jgi:hypothetical protein